MPKESQDWKEQTPAFYQFTEVGQELVGVLVAIGMIPIRDTEVKTYTVEHSPGNLAKFLGGVALDTIMENVQIGQEIKLQYTGKEKTAQGYQVKKFRLWTR